MPPAPPYRPPPDEGLRILALDARWIAVDKPAELLTVPGRGEHLHDCLLSRVQRRHPEARLVHRLDQPTSGIVILARDAQAQRRLSHAFETRQADKRYVAVVHGLVQQESGEIDLPLACDWPNRPRHVVDRVCGRPARTRYRVLSRDAGAQTTRLELQPLTGRTHQLRVHLQALGHPIVGDRLYATEHERRCAPPSPRLLLHAARLVLPQLDDGAGETALITLCCDPPF